MRNIIGIFLYFIVKKYSFNTPSRTSPQNYEKWRLKSSLSSPPSTQPSPKKNVYEKEIKKNKNTISVSYKKRNKSLEGFDARTIKNNDTKNAIRYAEEETANFLVNFKELHEKKVLLGKLENPNISILQKVYMLSTREIRPMSINIDTLDW